MYIYMFEIASLAGAEEVNKTLITSINLALSILQLV